MKTRIIMLAGLLAVCPVLGIFAEEPAMKCPMCEKMKQEKQAAAAKQAKHDLTAQSAELDKLVSAMNGSLGGEKTEAMAALLTRMVEMNKQLAKQLAQLQTRPAKMGKAMKKQAAAPKAHDESAPADEPSKSEPQKSEASEHDHH